MAALVVHRLRLHLPMQGMWVQALVQEGSTCRGAIEPVRRNQQSPCPRGPAHWTTETDAPKSLSSANRKATAVRSQSPRGCDGTQACSPPQERARAQRCRPNAAKHRINHQFLNANLRIFLQTNRTKHKAQLQTQIHRCIYFFSTNIKVAFQFRVKKVSPQLTPYTIYSSKQI